MSFLQVSLHVQQGVHGILPPLLSFLPAQVLTSHSFLPAPLLTSHSFLPAQVLTSHSFLPAQVLTSHSFLPARVLTSHSFLPAQVLTSRSTPNEHANSTSQTDWLTYMLTMLYATREQVEHTNAKCKKTNKNNNNKKAHTHNKTYKKKKI